MTFLFALVFQFYHTDTEKKGLLCRIFLCIRAQALATLRPIYLYLDAQANACDLATLCFLFERLRPRGALRRE